MNAGQFAKRRARIEHESWRRSAGYRARAMAALMRESGAVLVVIEGRPVAWKLPNGQTICKKTRYPNEVEAMAALVTVQLTPKTVKVPNRVYHCPWCDGWHMTSQRRDH